MLDRRPLLAIAFAVLILNGFALNLWGTDAHALGPEDEVTIAAALAPEISGVGYRVGPDGEIRLPMVGPVPAAGKSPAELERAIEEKLAAYVREPRVSVSLTETASRPVSVLGAVNEPGVIQLRGERSLAEALSSAGGLRPDAGGSLTITRRKQWGAPPLPGAELDAGGRFYVAKVDLKTLLAGTDPSQNIEIRPHDVITAPPAEQAYVIGAVGRPGGFPMTNGGISVLQALALAGGLGRHADPKKARILRGTRDGGAVERPIDLKKLLDGKAADEPLQAEEVLFVPQSGGKAAASLLVRTATSIGVGAAIWTAARQP